MRGALLWATAASLAFAQQPRVGNAKFESRAVTASVAREFQSIVTSENGPAWIGWAVRAVPGEHRMCCYNSSEDGCCSSCSLENQKTGTTSSVSAPISLEAPGYIFVLFRVEQHSVNRIRTFSAECELDAGALPFHWLTGVSSGESIATLSEFVVHPDEDPPGGHRLSEPAIGAIALHADPAADQTLEKFTVPSEPEWLRGKVTFWLGSARGRRGFEVLKRIVTQDTSARVREKAIFGLSVSKEPQAVPEMIAVARNDQSPRVRGQALFWLAQKAGKKAASAITEAIENDPDTQVKKRAVFALQQLPPDEGVPLLIQVARNNKNPAVRKQAFFWLGQTNDPRALRFFEDVLLK